MDKPHLPQQTHLAGEITSMPQREEDNEKPPRYSDPGRILVNVLERYPQSPYRWSYEVLDYDGDSCVFWIQEGTGFDYWLDNHSEFPGPGRYLIENITGTYIKGEWGHTDDDEEWECAEAVPTHLETLPELPELPALSETTQTTTTMTPVAEATEPTTTPTFQYQIGETYETQAGDKVTVLGRTDTKGYECLECSDEKYRYDRSTSNSDAGRVTGTAHDYSCPDNFKREQAPE